MASCEGAPASLWHAGRAPRSRNLRCSSAFRSAFHFCVDAAGAVRAAWMFWTTTAVPGNTEILPVNTWSCLDTGPWVPVGRSTVRDNNKTSDLMPSLTFSNSGPGFSPLASIHCAYAASAVVGSGGTRPSQASAGTTLCAADTAAALHRTAAHTNTRAEFVLTRMHMQKPQALLCTQETHCASV